MKFESVQVGLTLPLRGRPLGTTADLNNYTVAYWNGHEVIGIHLSHDDSGRLDEHFEFNERACNHLHVDLVAWMAAPR